jgi:hypothetical protein
MPRRPSACARTASISRLPMPFPCRPVRTPYVARYQSFPRFCEMANPTTSPSSSSATQQPPGSSARKWPMRSIHCSDCAAERGSISGSLTLLLRRSAS